MNTRLPSNLRHDHPRRVVCGAIWRVPVKIADGSWSIHKQAFATFYAPVTLTLTRWPSYTNLTRIPWRYTGCAKDFLREGFRKLSSDRQGLTTPLHGWSIRIIACEWWRLVYSNSDEHYPAPLWRFCDSDAVYRPKCHDLLTYNFIAVNGLD